MTNSPKNTLTDDFLLLCAQRYGSVRNGGCTDLQRFEVIYRYHHNTPDSQELEGSFLIAEAAALIRTLPEDLQPDTLALLTDGGVDSLNATYVMFHLINAIFYQMVDSPLWVRYRVIPIQARGLQIEHDQVNVDMTIAMNILTNRYHPRDSHDH